MPVFTDVPDVEQLGGIDVMPQCCTGFSAPFLTTDSLGNFQLYVGSEQGYIYLYDDIEGNIYGNYRLKDSLYLYGVNTTINGADINADGRPEFIFGEAAGGIGLLRHGDPPVYGIEEDGGDQPAFTEPGTAG